MLGRDLCAVLAAEELAVDSLDLPEFDITDAAALKSAIAGAGAVINCAAYTNVDGAESNAALAERVNADAPGQLGKLAVAAGIPVLHLSTDFVFDGRLGRPYRESDPPCPLSVYGRSKLAGEQALLGSGAAAAVVRIQWTYGEHGRNFIGKLLEQAAQGRPLRVVDDQVGSPTWTMDVSRMLVSLLRLGATGLYHYAAAGYASRFEVAEFVRRELGLQVPLAPCRSGDFITPATRPLNSRFDCSRLDAIMESPRPHWQDAMRAFLRLHQTRGGHG